MPTYTINGKRIKTDTQLTDEQIDEIAADLAKEQVAVSPEPIGAEPPTAVSAPTETPETAPVGNRSMMDQLGRQVGLTARAIPKSLGIPIAAGDLAMKGISALTGKELPTTTQSLDALMNRMGLPQPENATERAVQAAAGAIGDVATTGGIKTIAKHLPEALTTQLGRQSITAAGAGAGSQVFAEAAETEGYSPGITMGIALLGGLVGGKVTSGLGGAGRAMGSSTKVKETNDWFAKTKLGKSLGATVSDTPITVEDIKAVGSTAYKNIDKAGIVIRPMAAENLIKNAEKNIDGFIPDLDAHRPVASVLKHLKDTIAKKGADGLTFGELDKLRGDMSTLSATATERATKEIARKAVVALDEQINTLSAQNLRPPKSGVAPGIALSQAMSDLKEARSAWRRASKVEGLDHVMDIAALNAQGSGGKLSLGESLKREFLKIAKNVKVMRNYSELEKAQIRKLATGSNAEDLALQLARLDPRKGGFGSVATSATFLSGSPEIAATMGGSAIAAEKAVGSVKTKALNRLRQDILSKTVSKPTNDTEMRRLLESYTAAEQEMNN